MKVSRFLGIAEINVLFWFLEPSMAPEAFGQQRDPQASASEICGSSLYSGLSASPSGVCVQACLVVHWVTGL